MDDVLIFGSTQQEHNDQLHKVLQKLQSAGATLNRETCEFSKKQLSFLDRIINEHGVSPDPFEDNSYYQNGEAQNPH